MTARSFNSLFADTIDAAAPWDTAAEYVGENNKQFSLTVPATGGPYVTADGQTLALGKLYNFQYAADRTAADSVAAIADDAATVAEVLLMNLVGEVGTSSATGTFTGLQRIGAQYRPAEFEIANSQVVTGLDMTRTTGSLRLQFTDTGETGRPWPQAEIDLAEIRESGSFFVWNHDSAFITGTVNDLATGDITFTDVARAARFIYAEIVDFGANGFVIPTGKDLVTDRQLVVTSPTATPDITIIEEQSSRHFVNVTPGQMLVLGAVADATVQLISPVDGLIIAQATGPNPTVTFTETPVITDDVLIDVDAKAGTFYAFAGGINFSTVKAVYSRLEITGFLSRSGSSQIRPYSIVFDLSQYETVKGQGGLVLYLDIQAGCSAFIDQPNDADLGLTFRASGTDAPASGRMGFKVRGVV